MDDNLLIKLLRQMYESVEKTLTALFLSGLLVCMPFFINNAVAALHGDWVDRALSDVLTEKYGCSVTVKNVRLPRWRDIYFSSLDVRAQTGNMLIRSTRGSLHLKNFDLFGKAPMETELNLYHVIFFHEYYKNSPAFKRWKRALKKPVEVEELLLRVVQSEEKTWVQILKSRSKDVFLDGEILIDASGHLHDEIHARYSPWMMFTSLFPGRSS